jgi:hypothetical protein
MKVSKNNVPYVVFADSANGYNAMVMKWTTAGWTRVGPIASTSACSNTLIAIANNDVPTSPTQTQARVMFL